jgi:hypothetical protein
MHAKKVLPDSKEKKQASNLRVLVDFKAKKQELVFIFNLKNNS